MERRELGMGTTFFDTRFPTMVNGISEVFMGQSGYVTMYSYVPDIICSYILYIALLKTIIATPSL
jgi:hypothetical protein